jgi:hypothetical protein
MHEATTGSELIGRAFIEHNASKAVFEPVYVCDDDGMRLFIGDRLDHRADHADDQLHRMAIITYADLGMTDIEDSGDSISDRGAFLYHLLTLSTARAIRQCNSL